MEVVQKSVGYRMGSPMKVICLWTGSVAHGPDQLLNAVNGFNKTPTGTDWQNKQKTAASPWASGANLQFHR